MQVRLPDWHVVAQAQADGRSWLWLYLCGWLDWLRRDEMGWASWEVPTHDGHDCSREQCVIARPDNAFPIASHPMRMTAMPCFRGRLTRSLSACRTGAHRPLTSPWCLEGLHLQIQTRALVNACVPCEARPG